MYLPNGQGRYIVYYSISKLKIITDTNILIKAVIVCVGKKIGLKACGSKNKKESEPWWKRRIKKLINKVRKHINILDITKEER